MKKLLCLISGMNTGGAETFLMKIYRTLDRTKYQMDFCINTPEPCFYREEIELLGGRIYVIPSKSQSVKEFKNQLTSIVRENKYEHVLRITSNAAGFMDLKIAKLAGAKVCSARSSNSSDGGGVKAWITHRLGKLLYGKYVDVKLAPSDLAARYTFGNKAYKNGDVIILHNAVDLNVFRYDKVGRKKVRSEYCISDSTKIVGHIGRFTTQKNHTFLLEIFAQIHHTVPDTVLLLVGNGELQQQVKESAEKFGLADIVIFAGVRSDIPQLLSAMDVFVFPSLYEGMPNTVIEAQATGLACIISDTITKESKIKSNFCFMSLHESPDIWAKRILELSQCGREPDNSPMIKSGYDIRNTTKKFEEMVFETCCGRSGYR